MKLCKFKECINNMFVNWVEIKFERELLFKYVIENYMIWVWV